MKSRGRAARPRLVVQAATGADSPSRPDPAPGQDRAPTRQEIQAAERAHAAQLAAGKQASDRAEAAAEDEERLTGERIAAATRLRQAEAATADAATRMDALATRQREADARLASRAEAMQPVLPLIERLALYPTETMLAVPLSSEDAVRGLIVLRGVSIQLAQEAGALRRDQAALAEATRAVRAEAPKLAAVRQAQATEAADLDRQIALAEARRRSADADADTAARRAAAEAARAENLRSVLNALELQRKADEAKAREEATAAERRRRTTLAEAARDRSAAAGRAGEASAGRLGEASSGRPDEARSGRAAAAIPAARTGGSMAANARPRGQLASPVAGSVVHRWGDATEAGPAIGISYQAPPAARVVAPCGGRVVFADPFRSYGQLLIVDCGGGYHAVLAGFERLDVKVGQPVQASEPVGAMPGWEPGGTGRRPLLYIELRRDGQPVNPAPWLKSAG